MLKRAKMWAWKRVSTEKKTKMMKKWMKKIEEKPS